MLLSLSSFKSNKDPQIRETLIMSIVEHMSRERLLSSTDRIQWLLEAWKGRSHIADKTDLLFKELTTRNFTIPTQSITAALMIRIPEKGIEDSEKWITELLPTTIKKVDLENGSSVVYAADPNINNAFINAYNKNGMLNKAKGLFGLMKQDGATGNLFRPYVDMLTGYCRYGDIPSALEILQEMKKINLIHDAFAYGCIIELLLRKRSVDRIYDDQDRYGVRKTKHGLDTTANQSVKLAEESVAEGPITEERVNLAMDLFNEMLSKNIAPDAVLFSTFMLYHQDREEYNHVFSLFEEMKRLGVHADVHIYTIIINCLSENNDHEATMSLFRQLERGDFSIEADVVAYSSIMHILVKNNRWKDAIDVYQQMLKMNLRPTNITHHILLTAICNGDEISNIWKQLNYMIENNIHSIIAFHIVLNAFIKLKHFGEIEAVIKLMKSLNIKLSTTTYNILMLGYFKELKFEEASNIYSKMLKSKLTPPDVFTFTVMITGECARQHANEALEAYRILFGENMEPYLQTYIPLVDHFCKIGNFEMTNLLLEDAQKFGKKSWGNHLHRIILKNSYISKNKSHFLEEVKSIESYANMRLSLMTFDIIIRGYCFLIEDYTKCKEWMNRAMNSGIFLADSLLHTLILCSITMKDLKGAVNYFFIGVDERGVRPSEGLISLLFENLKINNVEELGVLRNEVALIEHIQKLQSVVESTPHIV